MVINNPYKLGFFFMSKNLSSIMNDGLNQVANLSKPNRFQIRFK